MQCGFAALLSLVAMGLMHWKFVDMWFGDKGGLNWFWRTASPSIAHRLARLSFLAMIVAVAFATSMTSPLPLFAVSVALIFVHLGLLIYLSERPN